MTLKEQRSSKNIPGTAEGGYEIIAENASDAIIRIDGDSRILYVNDSARRIFGYEKEEMLGQDLTFLMPERFRRTHKDSLMRYLDTGRKHLDWKRVEVPGLHRSGREIDLEISFGEYVSEGKRNFIGVARDVSERKKIFDAVRESEQILQGTIDALTAHIAVLDQKGVIRKVNRAWLDFARANDYEGEHYGVGSNYIEVCEAPPIVEEECSELALDARRGIRDVIEGRTELFEMEYPCHSPFEERWFIMRVTRFGEEETLRVVIAHENITKRRLAEKETRVSEEKYRVLSEAIPAIMFVADRDGRITFANRRWFEYTGRTKEQTYGTGWLDAIHPEDREQVEREWQTAIGSRRVFEAEFRLRKNNGEYRWYLSRILPRKNQDGEIVEWFGTGTDIESRKQVEEELRSSENFNRQVLESSPDCVKILDAGGRLRYMNDNGISLMEIEDFETLRGCPWETFWEGEGLELVKDSVAAARQGETRRFQTSCPTAQGRLKWWDIIVQPIGERHPDGELQILAVSRDITETKRISEALLRAEVEQRKEAEAANRAKDEFLSVLSHELRTPLNASLGWLRMLKTDRLDAEKSTEALEVIERNIVLQNELIEDLLDVSRIISGKMIIEKEELDFGRVVADAADIARPLAARKDITLDLTDSAPRRTIEGDPTRLQQIVLNLLNNAVKFTPKGGRIGLVLTGDGERLRLDVTDTGVGIEPEFLPHIFERFRQADSTTKRNYSGLGLGLTIVSHLTELHGGRIDVASEGRDRGTTFTLELPLSEKAQKAPGKTAADGAGPKAGNAFEPLEGLHILLVDDDIEGIIPLRMLFEQHRATVETAHSTEEALEKLSGSVYDLLVSDIGMPDRDGYELIRRVREEGRNRDIKAIALTAYAAVSDKEKALASGYHRHIPKPLDFDLLVGVIAELRNGPDGDEAGPETGEANA